MANITDNIARVLRVDKQALADLAKTLDKKTGKSGVMDKIVFENDALITDRLTQLRLTRAAQAGDIYDALIDRIQIDDQKLFDSIGLAGIKGEPAARLICDFTVKAMPPKRGFFLKHDKAREFLRNIPPLKIMANLGYTSV